jgi:HEAT repeat protein
MGSELRALMKDLLNADRAVTLRAMAELVKLGAAARPVIPALLPKLEDRGYEGQWAARALASLDPEGTAVVPILLCQLGEPDPQWRYTAAGALLRVGNRRGLDDLTEGLKNESSRHRFTAVSEIEKAGRKASPLLPALIQCARSRAEPRERGECLNVLPRVDPADRSALRALEAAAQNDEDPAVRDRAKSALRYAEDLRYGEASKSPDAAARCLASDPSADLRLRCLYVATSPRPFGTAAAAALKKAANDPDPRVRDAARQVLANPY